MSRVHSPLRGRMIFNVGARRSGTFWLQRIVAAHPQVAAVPAETHLFSHGIAPLMERFQHGARSSPQLGKVYAERGRLLDSIRDLCDTTFVEALNEATTHVAERTPLHVRHLGLISEIYPDAQVIHIIRDGRDVSRSMVAQQWPEGPRTIAEAAAEWRESVEAAREASLPDSRYLEIRYEALKQTPRESIERIYSWLGLPVDSRILDDAVVESRRTANVSPSSPSGPASARQAELTGEERQGFEAAAGDLLDELGYADARMTTASPARRPDWGSIRRLGRGKATHPAGRTARRVDRSLGHRQRLIDDLVEGLSQRRIDAVRAMLTDDVLVRVVQGGSRTEGRAGRAIELLENAVDSGACGPQVVGDVYPAWPTAGVVLGWADNGGQRWRVLFAGYDGDLVSELSLYEIEPIGDDPHG